MQSRPLTFLLAANVLSIFLAACGSGLKPCMQVFHSKHGPKD